ncbi:MAG: hypothetical protein E7287_11140 [Lachnospiraceae bacterium]|nr:hypothetical protein [Lachnospiraceae bacterium]
MAMRLSGLMSGMDTESIIQELVMVRRTKVDNTKKAQTKHQWKQEAWKDLNSQVLKLYNGALSNMRFESSFMKKTTKVSNPNVVSVITGENAMNSVQNLQIERLAKSAYMTGGELKNAGEEYKGSSKVMDILAANGLDFGEDSESGNINITVNGETKTITVGKDTTINGFVRDLRDAGLNASFDEKNQRLFISSKSTGKDQNFTIMGGDVNGCKALQALGISSYGATEKAYLERLADPANTDTIIAERLATVKDNLVAKKAELTTEQQSKLKQLDAYNALFDGVDTTKPLSEEDLEKVKSKLDSMKSSTNATEKAAYKELQSWVDDYNKITTELDDIVANKLEEAGTDENGNTVYQLTEEHKNAVTEQVEKEIASATELKNLYDTGALKSTVENKIEGDDARISLNGVNFESNSNTFEINGLTLTVNATTAQNEVVTVTTEDDTAGIYDMVKNFFKEYNTIINQMDKLYNADAAKDFEPLTEEEKEEMSESAVEEWEKKIKDAILRKDSTLGTVSSAMKEIMMSGVNVNGKTMYLSDFGIETLSYFIAGENEKGAYHIDGDPDDAATSGNADKLKSMIASDPQSVVSFFTGLSRNLYSKLSDLMRGTEYSSSYTLYDDKRMKEEYNDYNSKIAELEDKLNDYEDNWYSKFAAMETAMAKLQSNASAVTSLLGG